MKIEADARGRSLLVLLVLIWGASWPVVKVGVSAMPPVWFACLRYVVATVCGFFVVAVRGELRRPSAADWWLVMVSGVLQMAAYSALTAVALTRLPPGRASVLAFSTPLWVAPLSAMWLKERLTWRGLTGIVTGLAGVIVIVSPALHQGERRHLAFHLLLLCAAGAWAGTTGFCGGTGANRRYGCPCSGRRSCSPLFGHSDAARSACAVIERDGLTPRFAEMAAPSCTESVG